MVDGTGLENQRGATHRGFESLPLRQERGDQSFVAGRFSSSERFEPVGSGVSMSEANYPSPESA